MYYSKSSKNDIRHTSEILSNLLKESSRALRRYKAENTDKLKRDTCNLLRWKIRNDKTHFRNASVLGEICFLARQ